MSLMQLDIVLPSQHFGPRRMETPEHRLMIAVLEDALDCLTGSHGHRLSDEAKQWFLADETQWPYSFECICGALDLDANAVRQRLRVAPEQQLVSMAPARRRVYSEHTALRTRD